MLAAAEQADISGARFLESFVAGSETAYALGLTLTDTHYLSGWWATSTLGAIGAAAGAARALGMSREETAMAISLAALQANGMIAMLGTDSKPILAGQAAKLGLESALLAGLLAGWAEGLDDEAALRKAVATATSACFHLQAGQVDLDEIASLAGGVEVRTVAG